MICFPNAKINLGLQIKKKRSDNYHDIETVFYPLELSDILEVIPFPGKEGDCRYSNTGITIESEPGDNLCIRAWNEIAGIREMPGTSIHLHKLIPPGAGMGGGSSDAAFTLMALNDLFNLGISMRDLEKMAGRIGSDCPFFIRNRPVLATGRGEILEPAEVDLAGIDIMVMHPGIPVGSGWAYANVRIGDHPFSVAEIISRDFVEWQDSLKNDFEPLVFSNYPVVRHIKERMLSMGAFYSSMTGSGSAVFGLFDQEPDTGHMKKCFPGMFLWTGKL